MYARTAFTGFFRASTSILRLQSWRAVAARRVTEQHKAQLQKRRYPTRLRREGQRTYTGAIIGCSLLGAGALITT
jgi:hypothetical protein